MDKKAKIFVAGHKGMVGSAIVRNLNNRGFANVIVRNRQELDLGNFQQTQIFFQKEKPDYVFLCAAKVGGIYANNTFPADFIYHNLSIQNNIIELCYQNNVQRLLFLGSSCIYPKQCPQPIKEEYLLTGSLEPTNSAYALAKIAGVEMCRSYNVQHGTQYLAAMPTNLYGLNDNYDFNNSHVLPALIRKIHEAKTNQIGEVEIWGTGTPKREFLFSDDLAEACVFLMNLDDDKFQHLLTNQYYPLVNIGSGEDLSIKELAETIAYGLDYRGNFFFNSSKPDGTMKKLLDVSQINQLGWQHSTSLENGIVLTYEDFLKIETR